ncbi:MmgE/PrpD family protein [Pigmentiphaga soli]|uniref:MmgE/PrpD family protein n=1 Tax=Pigmentiphaga soli TaxID=1007095 RepID=A0ABP8H4L7_9BURK
MDQADAIDPNRDFTAALIRFGDALRDAPLPAEAVRRATDAITDSVGCMLLGARQPLEAPLRTALFGAAATGHDVAARLAPAALARADTDAQGAAALYLGTLAHAVDFDDISHPAYCHPTALLLPPLLARASALQAGGAALLRAYVVGLEVLGQLGRRLNLAHYEAGWHATATLGTLAATAAVCWLEGLPGPATRQAIGIAASMAGGVRQNFGTMTKPLHAGLPGRSAILAARLAAAGLTSADDALEGRHGFFKVLGGAGAAGGRAKPWGEPLEILTDTGIALKAYPCCAATHPAIDAARAVRRRLADYNPAAVRRVRVGASKFALQPLIHDRPATPLEGKFSMRYCIAAALLDDTVNMDSFLDDRIRRPQAAALMDRIGVEVDPRVADDREFAAIVDVEMDDGRLESARVDVASGKPGNWLDAATLQAKFAGCAGPAAPAGLFALCREVDGQAPVARLQESLAAAIGAAVHEAGNR